MANIKTLNEIGHLNSSGFGRPWPRHGLYLLHWFSHNYVIFDNNGDLLALYNPKRKEFGFHHFDNRLECDGNCYQLLPNQNFPYYEVGNLNTPGAGDLPPYVSQNYKGHHDDSNMDRIIISLHPGLVLDKVYVTQHEDVRTFDRQNTYRISKGLVRLIRNLELEELLRQAGYPRTIMFVKAVKRQETPARSHTTVCQPAVSQPDWVNNKRPSVVSPRPTPSRESVTDMPHDLFCSHEALSHVSVSIPESRVSHNPQRERRCCVIL
ncbi:uncharacterized protein LOC109889665 [Oncorhynchus kisutch]|uniref:uncharacterized protein LOC109889665 n=1 Tax=Oncorhynchus kisutch TaxID=8019 RepID=UPI0009A07C11|nr:uncharacterized protein LOC109889665 [Oncorhynchus kisutch]